MGNPFGQIDLMKDQTLENRFFLNFVKKTFSIGTFAEAELDAFSVTASLLLALPGAFAKHEVAVD